MSSDAPQQAQPLLGRQPEVASTPFWGKPGALEIGLVSIAALIFVSALSFSFVYDDRVQILDNPFLHSWGYLAHDFTSHLWAQTHKPPVYYRPLFVSWLRFNYALFGEKAWGWHLTTLLVHALVTLLVFRLALRLLQDRWQAAVAGLLFAVHPVHVENVAWVSGVVDPLLSIFFLGSLLCYLRWRERRRLSWMAGSLLLALLAMLTKEPGITLPAVVFVYAWIFAAIPEGGGSRTGSRLGEALTHAAPFALLALAYWVLRQAVLGTSPPALNSYATILLTLPGLLLFYLRLLVWPVGLSLFYDRHFAQQPTFGGFVLPLLVLALLAFALAVFLRRNAQQKEAAFSIAFALLLLCPALWVRWFPGDDFVHDRYLYLPSAGFAMLFAIAVVTLRGRPAPGWIGPPRQVVAVWVAALGLLVGCLAQQMNWANDLVLWFHCYQTAPHNQRVLNNFASILGERGEYQRAVPLFLEVLRQNPGNVEAQGNLGFTYYQMSDLPQAEEHLSQAARLDPYDSHSLLYLGFTLYKRGSFERAASELSRAILLDPHAKGAHLALSLVLEQLGDRAGATREAAAELANYPDEKQARERLDRFRAAP